MGTFYKELGEKRPHGNFGPARGLLRKPCICKLMVFDESFEELVKVFSDQIVTKE